MRLSHSLLGVTIVTLAGVLAACGGGGHASVTPPAGPGVANAAPATQSITITVNIPGRTAQSAVRNRQYVGAGTKSATFAASSVVVNNPTPTPSPGASSPPAFAPTPSATADVNCTSTCTATLNAVPVGMVTFTVNLYDAPVPAPSVAQGNLISSGSTTQLVTPSTTQVSLTFNGVPVGVQLNSSTNPIPNPVPMATVTALVAMTAQDADGYTIVSPGTFNTAYTLSTSQQPHVVFSPGPGPTSVATPGQVLTLAYDGSLPAGTVVQLYSSNAGIDGGTQITAGTVVIGPAVPAPTPSAQATPTISPSGAPTALAANTFPIIFQNSSGIPGAITVYVVGNSIADNLTGMYLTSLTSGALAPLPAASTVPIPGLTLGSNLEVDVPELCSARVYVALGGTTLSLKTTTNAKGVLSAVGPAPWTVGDASTSAVFDFLEYTWADKGTACPNPMGLDVSAVDAIGIPMGLTVVQPGQAPIGPVGLAPNAGSNVALGLSLLGAPWSTLVQSYQAAGLRTRVINPTHAVASPVLNGGLNFPENYFDAYMYQTCVTYSTTDLIVGGKTALNVPYVPALPAGQLNVYGRYSGTCGTSSQALNFYLSPSTSGTFSGAPIATFTGVPKTVDALGNAGYFVQPADPGNTIGRIISVGIDRSTFTAPVPAPSATAQSFTPMTGAVQPVCAFGAFYGGSATSGGAVLIPGFITNWYSALAHQYAYNNSVYGFADDDECGLYAPYVGPATYAPYPAGTLIRVTLEPY